MVESIVNRARRILSGAVGDLADAMEKSASETVMREAIRETDRALDDARNELGHAMTRRGQALRNQKLAEDKHAELQEKAQFAVDQSRDDLAEAAITRQVDLEAQMPMLQKVCDEAMTQVEELQQWRRCPGRAAKRNDG